MLWVVSGEENRMDILSRGSPFGQRGSFDADHREPGRSAARAPVPRGQDLLCTIDSTRGPWRGESPGTGAGLAAAKHAVSGRARESPCSCPVDPDLVVAMGAIWLAGAVFVPLNDRAPAAEVQHLLEAIRPAGLLDGRGPTRSRVAAASRPRGRVRHLDLRDHRPAEGHFADARRVSRAPGPCAQTPAGRCRRADGARARADTEPRARLRRPECRHLQRVLRAEGRSSTGLAATLRHG